MLPLTRRFLGLGLLALALAALCGALLATDGARRAAACAADPGWMCDLGPFLVTSFAGVSLVPLALVSILLFAFAWRAAARGESPGFYAAWPATATLGLLGLGAWLVSFVAERAAIACGMDVDCFRPWFDVQPHAAAHAVIFSCATILAAVEGVRRIPSRARPT